MEWCFRGQKGERPTQMKKLVVDTSVIVKWFSEDENNAEHANKLRRQILEGLYDIIVPDLLFYELANALRHNPNFTAEDVRAALDSIFDMEFDIRKVDSSVIAAAIAIAFKCNVTVYDAYFLALSQLERKPFVTADYKFAGRIKSFKNIVHLTEI